MGLGSLFKKKENENKLASAPTALPDELPPLPENLSQTSNSQTSIPENQAPVSNQDVQPKQFDVETPTQESSLQESVQPLQANPIPDQVLIEESTPQAPEQNVDDNNANNQNLDELPNFEVQSPESSGIDDIPINVRSESLLLKNIFVEREHYVSMLLSIKEMKDDLQSHGSKHRKLSATDLKLAKSFMKLSTIFEQSHEKFMLIESIIARDNV